MTTGTEQIVVEFSYCSDDTCVMQLWARGHHEPRIFREACAAALLKKNGDQTPLERLPVHQVYRRCVPHRSVVADTVYADTTRPGRGAFAATVLECWIPIFYEDKRA